MFSNKVSAKDYQYLEEKYKELEQNYNKLAKDFIKSQKDLEKQKETKEVFEDDNKKLKIEKQKLQSLINDLGNKTSKSNIQKQRKVVRYLEIFLNVINTLTHDNKIMKDSTKKYLCILPSAFRNEIDKLDVDVNEALNILRNLQLIQTDQGAFTTTKRVEKKMRRVIAVKITMLNTFVKLWNRY